MAETIVKGDALLHDPRLNKGTAFTEAERERLGLRGLLPPRILTLAEQEERILRNFYSKPSPLEQYIYLTGLQDRNETLFYRILVDHLPTMMPVIYTPTVGEACRTFGHIFRRPRGLYVTVDDRGHVEQILRNWPEPEVRVIVVTDGERILGLGDVGANGMGIPIGKLSLYTACAGIHPVGCLPITLDVGTDNTELRADPLYIGLPRPRVRGAEYLALLDEFIAAVEQVFPGVLLQFEDFATDNALGLLARYRNRLCTFNDDVQGTAAVALAGLYSAARISGIPLTGQRLLFLGAGSAATGIADLAVGAMVAEGQPADEARSRCWFFDSKGLVVQSRSDLAAYKRPYAHAHAPLTSLVEAIRILHPTALLGLSTKGGAFTPAVLQAMAELNPRPVIFALSNPTANSECTAEEAYLHTGGRAIFASGSPFEPVVLDGRRYVPGQGNNAYIFPGLGLGVLVARARRVTDAMFQTAARTLAENVRSEARDQGRLYPDLSEIRAVSAEIAAAVAEVAWNEGLAAAARPADLRAAVRGLMWEPQYPDWLNGASG
ncbi:MAG TPA: NAD-dependent malic enzyme [Gemmatimonadales bacterium]|jgi:malate dehydrogenase (oxaloacetate-decarboxylating)(NADP+)|nr:NAD-dependent malic enzyme [Gemmatimonadales bacterium]